MKRSFLAAVMLVALAACATEGGWSDELKAGGAAYDRGDYATALRQWRPLAEQGNADAQAQLGAMYYNGWGVPKDNAESTKWFRKSADQDFAPAQYNLGLIYNIQGDSAEGTKWLCRAIAARPWQGTPRQRERAKKFQALAMHDLGTLLNLEGDNVRSYMWFTLAVAWGLRHDHDDTRFPRAEMSAKYPSQVSEKIDQAERLARAWKPPGPCP